MQFCTSKSNYKMQNIKTFMCGFFILISYNIYAQISLATPNIESKLYLGEGKQQALIVGLGGSEGGNAWASDYWRKTREEFIRSGYAFLAIGYFGANGTPDTLQKIAIEDVHYAIKLATKNKSINKKKVAIVGGSRGADLGLLLGSYYSDIKCVIGIVASNVTFPGNTDHFSTSSWTFQNKELPFVPVNEQSVPYLIKGNLRGAFEAMLEDTSAEKKALIKVENINGPLLLLSATLDEICPSTPMSEKIILRLSAKGFKHHYEHVAIAGGHAEPLKHFDLIFKFLDNHFSKRK